MSFDPTSSTGFDDEPSPRNGRAVLGKVLIALALGAVLVALLLPATRSSRGAARRNGCQNNLKQIALALHMYNTAHGALPPAYTVDAYGKPLHSWRTLILPYLEEGQLYKAIDLTKPWDDPANDQARHTQVLAYCCPSTDCAPNQTTYLALVGPEACFQASRGRRFSEFVDGASRTLMVIEAPKDHCVEWMAPTDADEQLLLEIEPDSRLVHTGGFDAVFVDGHVQFLSADLSADIRRALVSIAGHDKVDDSFLR